MIITIIMLFMFGIATASSKNVSDKTISSVTVTKSWRKAKGKLKETWRKAKGKLQES